MIARSRRWWWVLLWVNLPGSLYGFWWYRDQLLATPVKYWLVVPDSPGATFLFTLFLAVLLAGGVPAAQAVPGAMGNGRVWLRGGAALLAAVAFASNMKYGLWTATVLPEYAWRSGDLTSDIIYLSLSHFGMWAQAMFFSWRYRPGRGAALAALAWLLFQDFVDYWLLHTHPALPADWIEPFARTMALTLSVVWGGYLIWLSDWGQKERAAS